MRAPTPAAKPCRHCGETMSPDGCWPKTCSNRTCECGQPAAEGMWSRWCSKCGKRLSDDDILAVSTSSQEDVHESDDDQAVVSERGNELLRVKDIEG